ncbi:MAG TPA: family 10 glycosylhydrolase, partial [Clostridia bacterium]|nr:family 10 glycosylhydrolase [Clostridia bacterium]
FNPGLPEVRDLIEKGVLEIVKKYQVDGVVFDDYFYPAQDFNDGAAYKKYGGGKSLDDWRRSNVDTLIRELHEKIGQTRKGVVFGISPFAVWANASSNKAGSDTAASVQSYYTQYADTRMWVKNHLIDYICPQIYWSIGFEKAAYNKVMDWWAQTVQGTGVKLYVAHTVSKVGTDESGWKEPNQIIKQLEYSQKYGDYGGSSFYNYSKLVKNALGVTDTLKAYLSKH